MFRLNVNRKAVLIMAYSVLKASPGESELQVLISIKVSGITQLL